jgi:hypothetical protein
MKLCTYICVQYELDYMQQRHNVCGGSDTLAFLTDGLDIKVSV